MAIDRTRPILPFLLMMPLLVAGNARAAETNDWIPDLKVWGAGVEIRGGGGYRDNLLLHERNGESSYFLAAGSDVTVWRLPVDRHQFFFLMSGDYFRYPEGKELDDEASGVAVAQYKNMLAPAWELAGVMQYGYVDQVVGVLTETNFNPTPVQAHIVGWRPALRRYVSSAWWLELEAYGGRQWFKEPLDDLWETGPRLRAGYDYGRQSSVQGTYKYTRRLYDRQNALAADGEAIDRTLRIDQHDAEIQWRHSWDAAKRWRSTTAAGWQTIRDNGGGFFGYHRYQIREQLRFKTPSWEAEGQVRVSHYDFLVQRTRSDTGPETEKTLVALDLRVTREILKNLSVYLQFGYEEAISNRAGDDYTSNKIGAGVDWEF